MSQTHIYYNVDLVNNQTVDYRNQPILSYQENRDQPILENAQDYYFSIIRFELNGLGRNIPLCIPVIEEGDKNPTSDVNQTIYRVGVMYNSLDGNGNHRQNFSVKTVMFEPQDKSIDAPISPNNYSNDYYFVHSYDHFVKLVNKALKSANDEASSLNGDISKRNPPMINYNVDSGNFDLYLDANGYGRKYENYVGNNDSKCRLFFNSNMYNLFANYPHDYLGGDVKNSIGFFDSNASINANAMSYVNIPECAYDIYPEKNQLNEVNNNLVLVKQEFESTSSFWSPVSSLTFTSNIIPISPEMTGKPTEFKDSGITHSNDNKNDYRKIITDMVVPLGSADVYKKTITYYPSGEYRLSEFTSARFDLRHIGIEGFYKLRRTGALVPLKLPNQASCSFKILFKHKSVV